MTTDEDAQIKEVLRTRVRCDGSQRRRLGTELLDRADAGQADCFEAAALLTVTPDESLAVVRDEHVAAVAGVRFEDHRVTKLTTLPRRKLAPSTVTAIVSMISSLLRFAARERLIERNVVRDLDRDDRPGVARQSEPRYLSADEVALLLTKMTDTFRPVAMICAYAGLRISETLGLTWADVDFAAKTIDVRRQLDDDRTVRNETKSPASTAVVPMLPALERELRGHRSRQAGVDLRLVKRDALVFTTATGKPQSRRNALRAVHAAGDAAGLNGDDVESVGLHDLRHSLVAGALDSGVTLAEAAVLARHANAKVTGAIYAGVSERDERDAKSKRPSAPLQRVALR